MADQTKALVIVAHPDDETIFCSGFIMSHPDWDWTILCLCRRDDQDRAPRFSRACKQLGARSAISDLDDERPERPLASLDEVKSRVLAMLDQLGVGSRFDVVFTHGANGEYGHNRHVEVHRAVREMLADKQLSSKQVFFFNYKPVRSGKFCVPAARAARGAQVVQKLGKHAQKKKHLLISSVYNFNRESFESLSCSEFESFKVKK
jgi:LmbE family N-acetylglucosaminyl deacetylase